MPDTEVATPQVTMMPALDRATPPQPTVTRLEQRAVDASRQALRAHLARARHRGLRPPPRLSLSEWAARDFYLSPENSSEPGRFNAMPFQVGIMDAITDPMTEQVTVMKSARVGYTTILNAAVGYHIAQDAAPCMVVQPTVDDAEEYSKDSIAPMMRDVPSIMALASQQGSKDGKNNIRHKMFAGGASLRLVGANSPRGFRRVTIRIVAFDEVDGYPTKGAGIEGDQIKLGIKRTETFWNRKIIIGSTPTVKGVSRIWAEFEKSDKRYFNVPCPHCDEPQVLKWANLKWPEGQPEAAYFVCQANGCVIEETDKAWMIEEAQRRHAAGQVRYGWVATEPFRGHAGFHIWAAYSLFPNAAWGKLAAEFLEAKKNPTELQVFINTVLGEVWEDRGERVDDTALMARREAYTAAPAGVVVVTAGVDVQGDRIEVEFVGWGLDEESWGLGKWVLHGDPTGPDIWAALDALLKDGVQREDGKHMKVYAAGVDAGYLTNKVAQFCRPKWDRHVWAMKGMPGPKKPVIAQRPGKLKVERVSFFPVGSDAGKDAIYGYLRVPRPGPGYCHFNTTYDKNHFDQLTAEEAVVKYSKGLPGRIWQLRPGKRRNEALDIRVYAYAALEGLKLMGLSLRRLARVQGIVRNAVEVVPPTPRTEGPEDEAPPPTPEAVAADPVKATAEAAVRLHKALTAIQQQAAAQKAETKKPAGKPRRRRVIARSGFVSS